MVLKVEDICDKYISKFLFNNVLEFVKFYLRNNLYHQTQLEMQFEQGQNCNCFGALRVRDTKLNLKYYMERGRIEVA